MLQIGICDDSVDARLALRALLERQPEASAQELRIFDFSSGEGLLGWYEKHPGELDLVFLDIELSGQSGMEAAHALRRLDAGLQLVFVTGYADYVYDGYAVGALGYLLKPPKPKQLADVLARARCALHRDREETFLCRSGESAYRILRRDILYFCSDRRQVQCVTASRSFPFYGRLDEVEQALRDERFVRIHQRYLVSAQAVTQLSRSGVTLQNGTVLPVSRSCQNTAMLALTRAMLK